MQLKTPQFWLKRNFISYALLPFAALYCVISHLVRFSKKKYKISKPVICVGNLIAGGSGKTPTAIALSKILREIYPQKDFEFAYLSTGYMGDGAKFVALRDGKHIAENVGDEPMLLIQAAPTYVAKKRVFGAQQIDNISKIKMVVLDDGMQDETLHKDFVILVVDGKIGFGNGFMIPAGPMREPMQAGVARADLVVVVGETSAELLQKLQGKKIVRAQLAVKNAADFSGKKLLAFCGLAYPEKFFSLLKKSAFNLQQSNAFPDHYYYTKQDLQQLLETAKNQGLELITTKKDWVKFPTDFQKKIPYLDVELEFLDKEIIIEEIAKIIKL